MADTSPEYVPEDDQQEQPAQRRAPEVKRRTLLQAGLASLVGVAIGRGQVQAADAAPHTTRLPLITKGGAAITEQTLSMLPQAAATDFFTKKLQPDPDFERFYKHFVERGFKFFPNLVHLSMGIRPSQSDLGEATPSLPFLLAIVPAAQPFEASAPNHEAASIVVLREREINTVLAGSVVVSHRPYQIEGFQVAELGDADELSFRRVDRKQLETSTPRELARLLGRPEVDPSEWDPEIGELADSDTEDLTALVYQNLLQASFDQGIYPPEGVRSLVADSPLLQKLALAHGIRYQEAVASGAGACCSCSTTCSCHGCTTSSSSSKKITNLQVPV